MAMLPVRVGFDLAWQLRRPCLATACRLRACALLSTHGVGTYVPVVHATGGERAHGATPGDRVYMSGYSCTINHALRLLPTCTWY